MKAVLLAALLSLVATPALAVHEGNCSIEVSLGRWRITNSGPQVSFVIESAQCRAGCWGRVRPRVYMRDDFGVEASFTTVFEYRIAPGESVTEELRFWNASALGGLSGQIVAVEGELEQTSCFTR